MTMTSTATPDAGDRSITIVEDHPLIAAAMKDLINQFSRAAQVQLCRSLGMALPVLVSVKPRLVILDICLPDASGPRVLAAVREAAPGADLVLWSGNEQLARTLPEVGNGKIPFLSKALTQKEMTRALQIVLRRCGLLDALGRVGEAPHTQCTDRDTRLSVRQRQILGLLATGRTNLQMASALNVSTDTIKTHLSDIFSKLRVTNRTQAVLWYQSDRLTWQSPAGEIEQAEPAAAGAAVSRLSGPADGDYV
jgi:NarL family two-component system response regulator LiaR